VIAWSRGPASCYAATVRPAAKVLPVVVIFSFVIGVMLFGIIGLLLAVPTAASIKLILQHHYAEPVAPAPRCAARARGPHS